MIQYMYKKAIQFEQFQNLSKNIVSITYITTDEIVFMMLKVGSIEKQDKEQQKM